MSLTKQLMAARAGFFTGGFTVASWAPIIPFVQAKLNLEPQYLGALLLALGVGSFIGMPLAGSLSRRFGCRTAIALSGFLSCLLLVVLALIPSYAIEFIALFLYGITLGCLEVSVNIYGAELEKQAGTSVMSGLHAWYSIGEVLSAAALTGLLVLGAGLSWAVGGLMFALTVIVLMMLSRVPNRRVGSDDKDSLAFAAPKGKVLMLSLICLAVFLAEGAMLDWSALYIHQVGGIDLSAAGLGYTLFVTAMAISRLAGDRLIERFGSSAVLYAGLCLNIVTLIAMVICSSPGVLFASLFVMGLGIANVAPILISSAAGLRSVESSAAITTVTTVGYGGLMAGPAILGFIAQHFSLQVSFISIAVLLVMTGLNFMVQTRLRKA